ncbi:ribonuclease 3 [Candidatus Hydrogenosomobacter endosymbioticus]|uniref:Ribonuclease 3 n=2 Tax=Candidatus Hydrogenosomobacter endosymbioticus TaxID=2558174 RepID=A0ABM7V869_9PROT|nr:ribonuclease 3 [Candidatus Hydrogenosomobacter endosymbioticus]
MGDLSGLCDSIGYSFSDVALLRAAVSHGGPVRVRFERLEFMGDRVVGLVVADALLAKYPFASEGELARRHANLVSRTAMRRVASEIGVERYVFLDKSAFDPSRKVFVDVVEAIVGAVYIDGGFSAGDSVVRKLWSPLIAEDIETSNIDPKSALQELLQSRKSPLPQYFVVLQTGPQHNPIFTVEVSIPEGKFSASGYSKQEAEQKAAAAAFGALKKTFGTGRKNKQL